jgi:hypothetical protein
MIQDAENADSLAVGLEPAGKRLGRAEFQGLGDMPPELEWFANLDNPRTRRAYRLDVREFTAFAGVERPEEMRQVTRAHRNRLAQGPRAPRPGPQFHPAQTRRGGFALRPPLRGQRGEP